MINKDILEYVEKYKNTYSRELLIEKLKIAGYPTQDIDDSLNNAISSRVLLGSTVAVGREWVDFIKAWEEKSILLKYFIRFVAFGIGVGLMLGAYFLEAVFIEEFEDVVARLFGIHYLNFEQILLLFLSASVVHLSIGYWLFRRIKAIWYGMIAGAVIPLLLLVFILVVFRGFFW